MFKTVSCYNDNGGSTFGGSCGGSSISGKSFNISLIHAMSFRLNAKVGEFTTHLP